MGETGTTSIRRLKRLARGESTAVVMGMAGGVLLAAVMWRGTASSDRNETRPSDVSEKQHSEPSPLVSDSREPASGAAARPLDEKLAATLAELEALPEVAPESIHVASSTARRPDSTPRELPTEKSVAPFAARHEAKTGPTGEATLAFWQAMNDVIDREGAMRAAPVNLTAANAGGFVEARVRAGQFAAEALRHLPRENVDRDVVAHAAALTAWYDEEARLAGEASSLLGSSDIAARRGQAGKSWRNAEEAHRQRCDEINRASATLQTQLSRVYGREFPPLK